MKGKGPSALLMMGASGAVKNAKAKEIKFGMAIALSLDQFESMHLTFRLAFMGGPGD